MKIWQYLSPENIFLDLPLSDKDGILRYVSDAFKKNNIVKDADPIYEGLILREKMMSTGIGQGIGIPHTTSIHVKDASLIMIRLAQAVDFEAIDDTPVDLILALIIPENNQVLHLRILAGISRLCKNSDFLNAARTFTDAKKLLEALESIENHMAFH